ncbi:MAG: methionine ABC transporter permease [Bdellovibrionota bacterium]
MIDFTLLYSSLLATLLMVFVSAAFAFIFGISIAIGLTITAKGQFLENSITHKILSAIVTLGRSIPFVILMIAIIPLTRFIVGTSIGTSASIVPLAIAAIPYFARLVEGKFKSVSPGVFEAAKSMGLSPLQIIFKVLLPEAFPGILNATTILLVSLTEYSAMAGAIGGSGLGNMAIQYGYYQFNNAVLLQAIAVLIILVLVLQYVGDFLTKKVTRNH